MYTRVTNIEPLKGLTALKIVWGPPADHLKPK